MLMAIITIEDNFLVNKHALTGNSIAIANEIFDFLDRNKDGFISFNEFTAALKDCGYKESKSDFRFLFDMFDNNADGKISFSEFHNPGKTAEVEALRVF